MNNSNIRLIVNDFYALVKLRGEDDEECSRAQWLRCQASDFGGEEEEPATWCARWRFRGRSVTEVKAWADATFKTDRSIRVHNRQAQSGGMFSKRR